MKPNLFIAIISEILFVVLCISSLLGVVLGPPMLAFVCLLLASIDGRDNVIGAFMYFIMCLAILAIMIFFSQLEDVALKPESKFLKIIRETVANVFRFTQLLSCCLCTVLAGYFLYSWQSKLSMAANIAITFMALLWTVGAMCMTRAIRISYSNLDI